LHLVLGKHFGYPALVEKDPMFPGLIGTLLQKISSAAPLITIALVAFNVSVIVQEFTRGVAARQRSAEKSKEPESTLLSLFRLVDKSRRRYGGYIVHLGICCMFVGFVGTAWNLDMETSLAPGQSAKIGAFELTYTGSRMCPGNPACSHEEQADLSKRMIFADLEVKRAGVALGRVSPAKFIYHKSPDGPTTEVAMMRSVRDDLYTIVATVNPETKRATFKFHVNPFVSWVWIGLLVLIGGASVSLWPEVSLGGSRVWAFARSGASIATGTILSVWLAMTPAAAYAHERPQSTARPALVMESPLPRLFESGAWWPIAAGLGLGGLTAFGLTRRRRDPA
jgi:cytochrome c-type biogenesis protein CcmF